MRERCRLLFFLLWAALASLLISGSARAETLEAPTGGAAIPLGKGNFACVQSAGGWLVDPGGRSVRPPSAASAIGSVTELRVASVPSDCPKSMASLKLVATGPWPALDPASFTLSVDDGRLKGSGHGLTGTTVSWPTEDGIASDRCHDVTVVAALESCVWGVPKTLPADPHSSVLRWWPAGAQVTADAALFTAEGKPAAPRAFAIVPSRVEVTDLLPPKASIDVASGVGRVALVHPEVVVGVDCRTVRCSIDSGMLVVQPPPASVASIDVQFRLAAHVYDIQTTPPETAPLVHVNVLRCPIKVASGLPLRGIDGTRIVVRLEGACMRELGSLAFLVGSAHADVGDIVTADGASYVVLETGNVRAPEIAIAAVRADAEGAVVAMTRTETRQAPIVRTTLEISGFPPLDFIPRNRRAIVHAPHLPGAELALVPVPDVYDATAEGETTTVQGAVNANGLVALQFGYRVPSLPAPFDTLNLAVLPDVLQRSVKEANIPAPLDSTASATVSFAEVVCTDEGVLRHVVPGVTLRVSYSARNNCRVVLHRDRLSSEFGTQKLSLEVEVDKVDGTGRPESHVLQTLVLRPGSQEPLVAWIKGVRAPYDRVIVKLSYVADEAHYLGALDIITGEPAVQWTVLFPSGRIRAYATTVVPTGLYRLAIGSTASSGVLAVSLGVLSRLTWLDQEGHEGLLGLEAGVIALGLAGEVSTQGQQLFEVGAVAGIGLSLPIANAGQPAQASVSLHVWFEQLVAETGGSQHISEEAIIFGPSISLGNVGATF